MSKVLVVEDNPNNMKLITMVLKRNEYETIGAVTGEEGVEMAASENPDIILMDIQLPGIDGYETTRQIKELESMKDVPIIAITSYAMAGDRETVMDAGCSGYLEKPINPLTIMDKIEKIVKGDV